MKFAQPLVEATLLKRQFGFLAEVALSNKTRRMIYCPTLLPLNHCAVLGSRLWFSKAHLGFSACLDTWTLTEIDQGFLVNMNPVYTKILVREAALQGKIAELAGYHCLQQSLSPSVGIGLELFWQENGAQCFVHMEPVWADQNHHYLSQEQQSIGMNTLKDLMAVRRMGHKAVLLYCVQQMGVTSLCVAQRLNANYQKLLQEAIDQGVCVLAYGVSISLEGMSLDRPLSLAWSEGVAL